MSPPHTPWGSFTDPLTGIAHIGSQVWFPAIYIFFYFNNKRTTYRYASLSGCIEWDKTKACWVRPHEPDWARDDVNVEPIKKLHMLEKTGLMVLFKILILKNLIASHWVESSHSSSNSLLLLFFFWICFASFCFCLHYLQNLWVTGDWVQNWGWALTRSKRLGIKDSESESLLLLWWGCHTDN